MPPLPVAPLAAMEITFGMPLIVVNVRMISIIVSIPAIIIPPVPAFMPDPFASMLLAMVPPVFVRVANFTEKVLPVITLKTIIVGDDHPACIWCKPQVLVLRICRYRSGSQEGNGNADLNQ